MEYNWAFYTILFFVTGEYLFSQWLSWLNRRSASPELPSLLSGLYNKNEYARQQEYFRANNRFSFISGSFSYVVLMLMLCAGGFGWLNDLIASFGLSEVPVVLLFFGILYIGSELLSLPFDWYDTFVIEAKFGFNKTLGATFVTDRVKSLLLGMVVGGILLSVIVWLYLWVGSYFWIFAWGVVASFMVVMNFFYSEWIVPLFNRQIPLEPGELRTAIESFSREADFDLDNIYVIDGSRRSTKANAYFSGLGPKKRIVLYDTLIDELTTDEIVAVLAHETGHYVHKHTRFMLLLSLLNMLLLFYLFSLLLTSQAVALALGAGQPSFQIALIAFSLLYTPVGLLVGLLLNVLSRRHEYQADAFAASYGYGDALISGLKKISVRALSNLTPHRFYVFVHYSHPTLLQRMNRLHGSRPTTK